MTDLLAMPVLRTGHRRIDQAWRCAIGDLLGNIRPYPSTWAGGDRPQILAGLFYDDPWTRDAAIQAWNGAGLLVPEAARDTLLGCLVQDGGAWRIGGQQWDAAIWITGMWAYIRQTGDRALIAPALAAARASLDGWERTAFNPATGLFHGGGCYLDGVSGYPDRYADTVDGAGGIEHWQPRDPALAAAPARFPAMVLSTNCVYARAYDDAAALALAAGADPGAWPAKAAALRAAIDRALWDEARGTYRFLADAWGGSDRQEGLGLALAILNQVADPARARRVLATARRSPAGLASIFPDWERYAGQGPGIVGRHAAVWPHINLFWADAAARCGDRATFSGEFLALAKRTAENGHFSEVIHPETGRPDGGRQEGGRTPQGGIRWTDFAPWGRQTWCATGYLRVVLRALFGLRFQLDGLRLTSPLLPDGVAQAALDGLRWRDAVLDLRVVGAGSGARLDGRPLAQPLLPAGLAGRHTVELGV